MNKNIELRLEYTRLMIEGENKKAWNVLNKIWNINQGTNKPKQKDTSTLEKIVEIQQPKIDSFVEFDKGITNKEINTINDLGKIKGVGKSTVKELEQIYGTLDELIKVIKSGINLKTRDDIELKIKKGLNI